MLDIRAIACIHDARVTADGILELRLAVCTLVFRRVAALAGDQEPDVLAADALRHLDEEVDALDSPYLPDEGDHHGLWTEPELLANIVRRIEALEVDGIMHDHL